MGFMVGTYSDAGSYREVNQDAFCFLEATGPAGPFLMAIVCDGVGGFSSGELASSTVISRFCEWFDNRLPTFLQYNSLDEEFWIKLKNVWSELLKELNTDIFAYGKAQGISLGTTFTGLFVYGGCCLVGQVGDSRAYEIARSSGKLVCKQVTKDQTVVALEVEAGAISPEEAARHPRRHVLLQAVGTQQTLEASFAKGKFQEDAVYLICCDGFYGQLESRDIAAAFDPQSVLPGDGAQSLGDVCRRLAELGMERGEKDNITAVAFGLEPAAPAGMPGENPSDFADTLSFERQPVLSYECPAESPSHDCDGLVVNDRFVLGRHIALVNSQTEVDEHCLEVVNRLAQARGGEGDTL